MVQQANAHNNELLGKELKYFSQAGFDLDRIHIKVSSHYRGTPSSLSLSSLGLPSGDNSGT